MKSLGYKIIISFIVYAIFVQLLTLFLQIYSNNLRYFSFAYTYLPITTTTLLYIALSFLIWHERENLNEFHIDKFTIITFIISSFLRVRLGIPKEGFFLSLIALSGIFVSIISIHYREHIEATNLSWSFWGIAIGFVLVFLMVVWEIIFRPAWEMLPLIKDSYSYTSIKLMLYIFATVPAEEILFRGFLLGYLQKMNYKENKGLVVQGVLFWVLHIGRIFTPFNFFVAIPLLTITVSWLIAKSKQLFPSILAHSIINMLAKFYNLASY